MSCGKSSFDSSTKKPEKIADKNANGIPAKQADAKADELFAGHGQPVNTPSPGDELSTSTPNISMRTPSSSTPLQNPPSARDLFVHTGPLEDVVEVYVNGTLNGQVVAGTNTVRVLVKAEGEVHYWSYNIVVKGVIVLTEKRERWIDGSIPKDTVLSDKSVTFTY